MYSKRLLIDAREFVPAKRTGIGRVLEGLIDALAATDIKINITLASTSIHSVPCLLKNRKNVTILKIPNNYFIAEMALSKLCRNASLFLSPYPKLPLYGCRCSLIHIIHDVLELTHPAYKKRVKVPFNRFRLKSALKKASLTWYVSSWSLKETKDYVGFAGKNPRVRRNGIDERFTQDIKESDKIVLEKHRLSLGYILVIGNGMPHKNLGVLLSISDRLERQLVFVGVPPKNRAYWERRCPRNISTWINHVKDEDLSAILRGAFCVAQPSTAEGYGYPPLEAMACGIPSVVSNIPVLLETTGGNALAVDPKNSEAWAKAFERLEDRSFYQGQVARGLKWVEPLRGRMGWEKHISDIAGLLRSF